MTETVTTQIPDQSLVGNGLAGVPLAVEALNRKAFTSDQEVRWCPGCGDYVVLNAFLQVLPELAIKRENTVVISGIGCSSRFPYYVNSYGMHSIHGRALTIATGLAMARDDLAIFVATGDGDALSIGGNHLIHALRRNVNLTILLFNNRIYGLTKGQYSPTSELGKITKSSPLGSLDTPVNAISLALGAEATFVARTIDSDKAHLTATLKAAAQHRGASLVEIYQNCPIFNDGAFAALEGPDADQSIIRLRHGEPITFADGRLGVVRQPDGSLQVAEVSQVGAENVVVHDAHTLDPTLAFALSRLTGPGVVDRAPIGVFRDVERPTFDDVARQQLALAQGQAPTKPAPSSQGYTPRSTTTDEQLTQAIRGDDTWLLT